jgi:hypothetical protein
MLSAACCWHGPRHDRCQKGREIRGDAVFSMLKALFEIGLSKNPIQVAWEKLDDRTRIGYFTSDAIDVHYITLSRVEVGEIPLLSVSFGMFIGGKQQIGLTRKNKDQFLILGTVLRAIKEEINHLPVTPVVVFTAKADRDTPEGFEKRKSVYRHIAQVQHKKMGGSLGDFPIDDGHLFYVSSRAISRVEVLKALKSQEMLSLDTVVSLFKK